MKYLKKELDAAALDSIRINASTQDDKLLPSSEPICDWCGEDTPKVVYASKRMANGEFQQCWRWAACARCERMIEHENWDALERRVTARFKKFFGERMQKEFQGGVPESLIHDAVKVSLDQFHEYGIQLKERNDNAKG